jgi:hypothetical protein
MENKTERSEKGKDSAAARDFVDKVRTDGKKCGGLEITGDAKQAGENGDGEGKLGSVEK